MATWTDKTTYSQHDKERTPRIWKTSLGPFRLTVHRHKDYPGKWLASSYPEVFDCVILASPKLEEAQCQAVAKLQCVCEDTVKAILESAE